MKSVLISIRPEWCEKIARGQKTVEIRKTRPKLETPFKCYIYCTLGDERWRSTNRELQLFFGTVSELSKGKVIGEFVCDAILRHCEMANADIAEVQGLVSREKIFEYAGGKEAFGWHISDLKIYEQPRDLGEFTGIRTVKNGFELRLIDRPPQSWCYVAQET